MGTSPNRAPGPARFAGLILAGGEGRRFGEPKAFARLADGRTFLEASAGILMAAGARPLAATVPPRHAGHEVPGLRQIPLPESGMDMLASLRWGLRHLISDTSWERVVVLPVDHPLVAPETIRRLGTLEAEAAIPSSSGRRGHPTALGRDIATAIARGELAGASLREILSSVETVEIPVDDPGVVANCNTPQALRDALSRAHDLNSDG